MSDEKYTKKEREFLRLHELEHTLMRLELAGGITRPIAERGKPMPDQSHLYIDCTEGVNGNESI